MTKKFRVLAADDEPRYVRAIQVNLEASGYEVLTAQDGQQALDLVASVEPDLVLLDIRMPRLDGLSACRRIREFSMVPIIMLTAKAEEADKVLGLDAGADDHVTKPFSADELVARVRAVLRRVAFSGQTKSPAVFQRRPGPHIELSTAATKDPRDSQAPQRQSHHSAERSPLVILAELFRG